MASSNWLEVGNRISSPTCEETIMASGEAARSIVNVLSLCNSSALVLLVVVASLQAFLTETGIFLIDFGGSVTFTSNPPSLNSFRFRSLLTKQDG